MAGSDTSAGPGPVFKKKAGFKRDIRSRRARETHRGASSHDESALAASAIPTDEAEESSSSVILTKKRRLGGLAGAKQSVLQSASLSRHAKNVDRGGGGDSEEDEWTLDRFGEGSVSSIVRARTDDEAQGFDARNDATRTNTWYDELGHGAANAEAGDDGISRQRTNNDDGLYRGASAYSKFIEQPDNGNSAKIKGTVKGPVRASNNVRTITMVDYQPDVCKDYKETGYCGFGDTCKFLHDRSDYLAGWQLDALPNSAARQRGDLSEGEEQEEEEIPFACLICRQPFTDPIVTKCGHYFCSACAIKRFTRSTKCFACGKQTQGIFNSARKVLDRMERVRAERQEERDRQRWDNEDGAQQTADQGEGEILEGVEIG